jgi:HSP20 family protein
MERFLSDDFPFLPIIPKPKMGWDMAVDNPEKLNITVKDGYLKIVGFREEEKEKKETNFYYKEIRRGDFDRWVKLPVEVKAEKAEAQYKNGVLKVLIPKKEEVKEEKIKIQFH